MLRKPRARGREDGVAHGRRQADDAAFSSARGGQILAVEKNNLNLRRVAKSRHTILREVRVQDASVGKPNLLKQRPANSLDDRSGDLVAQTVGIDDGS